MPRFAAGLYEAQLSSTLDQLAESATTVHPNQTWPAVGAERVSEPELRETRAAVKELAKQHGYPEPLDRGAVAVFDRALARALFDHMSLTPTEAADGQMWSFVALVLLPDVVWWRADGSTNRERYIGTDLTRHTVARLWWRAHLFTSGLVDPEPGWRLWNDTQIGEADLDQIQTRRAGFGKSPKAFRSLIRIYSEFEDIIPEGGVGRRELWRAGYLRGLLRIGAFVDFNALSEDDLEEDLRAVAAAVVEAGDAPHSGAGEVSEASAPTEDGLSDLEFDDLALADLVVHIARAVRREQGLLDHEIAAAFTDATGVEIPPARRHFVTRVAWHANTHGYVKRNDAGDGWMPGIEGAPDRRWSDWTVNRIKADIGANGKRDYAAADVAAEYFSGPVKRLVSGLFKDILREMKADEAA